MAELSGWMVKANAAQAVAITKLAERYNYPLFGNSTQAIPQNSPEEYEELWGYLYISKPLDYVQLANKNNPATTLSIDEFIAKIKDRQ